MEMFQYSCVAVAHNRLSLDLCGRPTTANSDVSGLSNETPASATNVCIPTEPQVGLKPSAWLFATLNVKCYNLVLNEKVALKFSISSASKAIKVFAAHVLLNAPSPCLRPDGSEHLYR